jgi:hypothetical protein
MIVKITLAPSLFVFRHEFVGDVFERFVGELESKPPIVILYWKPEYGLVVGERRSRQATAAQLAVDDIQTQPRVIEQRAIPIPYYMLTGHQVFLLFN